MSKADQYDIEIKKHQSEIRELRKKRNIALGDEFFCCPECSKRTKVKNLTLVKEHYWVSRNNEMGEHWQLSRDIICCNKCNKWVIIRKVTDEHFVTRHEKTFREVLIWYKDYGNPRPTLKKLRFAAENLH